MNSAIYPGTFDPITNGHIDIVQRAVSIFGQVLVSVVEVSTKDALFSFDQRIKIS